MNLQPMHLTDDQLDALLLGDATSAQRAHLAACTLCQQKCDAFQSTLAAFNQASLDWSQARSHALPVQPRPARPFPGIPAAAWAFAALLLFTLAALWTLSGPRQPTEQATDYAPPALSDTPSQIASDNAMLADINSALRPDETSPLAFEPATYRPNPHRTSPQAGIAQ